MIEIIDVIITGIGQASNYPRGFVYVVTSRKPEFVYERRGSLLIAHDDGFYDTLVIEAGSKDAFAGRSFEIKLTDGSNYHCHGQVWSAGQHNIPEEHYQCGVSTLEALSKCYVFCSAQISTKKLDEWLSKNKPGDDYWKYDRKRKSSSPEYKTNAG